MKIHYFRLVNELHQITEKLTLLKPELMRRYGVSSIGVFGSFARGDFSSDSDVDVLVDFNRPIGIEFIDLANFIEDELRKKVDLVSRKGIKAGYLNSIQSTLVYV